MEVNFIIGSTHGLGWQMIIKLTFWLDKYDFFPDVVMNVGYDDDVRVMGKLVALMTNYWYIFFKQNNTVGSSDGVGA